MSDMSNNRDNKDIPHITEAESEVMKLLWENSPLAANEIITKLTAQMEWSDQTIKTFLNRLHKKQAIQFEKKGRTYLYSPLVSYDEYLNSENKSFLNRVYNGAAGMLCAKFIEEETLSDQDIDELQQLLERKRK
ncbi:BlaI family penicillinase repressor [Paenibacillus turicensis]|uniref:BlaI family penicillinase repressor n=1 Tax=Paenibacillus turicensis TaxID=160487 RepID=A0ABS4FRZ0_9BACL|nr:BlaI/MecI/CopY family transcriptional regulator [Paenibacillus turicensis]MBP1905337.1 BlaI family penicillinase repressor [Paenibacillus turicensis]